MNSIESDKHELLGTSHDEIQILFGKLVRGINQRITTGSDYERILDFVFSTLDLLIPYDRIGIALLDESKERVSLNWVKSKIAVRHLKRKYSAPIKGSSLESILRTGQPRIIDDLAKYLEDHPKSRSTQLILNDGIRSSLTCPLKANGKAIGIVFFSCRHPGVYNRSHIELFCQISDELSVIVRHDQLNKYFEQNQSRSNLFRTMLHDIKSPLAVVEGFLELAESENWYDQINQDGKETLQAVHRNVRHMNELVNDLAEMISFRQPNNSVASEEVDLHGFVSELSANGHLLAQRKNINFEVKVESDIPTCVNFDRMKIRRALDNLFTNAIKFSPRNTTITFGLRRSNSKLIFSIKDEGQGIPLEEQNKLFQEFSRTSVRPTEGEGSSGLGLAIVKNIIDLHGGTVDVKSEPGRGSTFSFALPINPYDEVTPALH